MSTESEYKQRDGKGYAKATVAAETSLQARNEEVPIGSADDVITPALTNRRSVLIRNDGRDGVGPAIIWIGGPDLTTQNGYPLPSGDAPYRSRVIRLDISEQVRVLAVVPASFEELNSIELA